MAQINMVPFIDVMLVLLTIFMVTAPLMATGVIEVPSAGKKLQSASSTANVLRLARDKTYTLLDANGKVLYAQSTQLDPVLRAHSAKLLQAPLVLQADKRLSYEDVMGAMAQLRAAGLNRIALAVAPE